MVSIRRVHQDDRPQFSDLLAQLPLSASTKEKLRSIAESPDILLIGQEMVEILHELHMDDETLQAALIFPYCQIHALSPNDIIDSFGENIAGLVLKVRKMDAIKTIQSTLEQNNEQVEKLRNMMLAMAEDVRAVVIKMAERICTLHRIKDEEEETRVLVARECANIYAPLANRLGIGQLKWELEDLSFRYLHPDIYKKIAKQLKEKRKDREQYITDFVEDLQLLLDKENIQAEVIGRPKHIYSIYKKMHKKQLSFEQLFDIRALRIIANRLQDCYAALGTVHAHFRHLPSEFDDYIATPKPNGYQSIHTVVVGPAGKSIEIQIRTEQMHQDAELGVAAHWRYKEGSAGKSADMDERVMWLRKILQWQEEMAESGNLLEEFKNQVFDDRVYVFTPKGDVIDMPAGATPLDFAYYIHSNVGHRCTGAKVNERIVPFTYRLQTGDQVSVLTSKSGTPSRDWMHPGLGYAHTARARATIHSYFKRQDKDKNREAGKELLERELTKVHVPLKIPEGTIDKYNMKSLDDLHAAIGAGDIRVMTVVHYLSQLHEPVENETEIPEKLIKPRRKTKGHGIVAEGVGNLLSNVAKCCQPVAGDPIVGFITIGKGISVHKAVCTQLDNMLKQHPEREIEVNWESEDEGSFQTNIKVFSTDRDGLLRDLTTELANLKVNILGVSSHSDTKKGTALINITVEVPNTDKLKQAMQRLLSVPDITSVSRG
ncbi:GTP diphosphokinase [Agaribacter marinus]|uniref:GTP pyrophosphokinase n=1 Tax=Agaribacter marinus TaxID=1431249 RepID=A0AA37WK33_9ALTE|nr:GTP diphosphokinase [Agaribacter marinus]GLR72723.1 GTP pyrophosphokinase [Agaribacter marinus]